MIGGIITIIWVALVSVVSYMIFAEFLDTTKPVVSVNRIRLEKPLLLNTSEHEVGGVYLLFNGRKFLTFEETQRYVTFKGVSERTSKQGNTTISEQFSRPMVKCADLEGNHGTGLFGKGLASLESKIDFTTIFLKSIICGDTQTEYLYYEGSKFSLPYNMPRTWIYPCSLPNRSNCASVQELSLLQVGYIHLTKVAKYRLKGNPLQIALEPDNFIYVDTATQTKIVDFFKMNEIYDDDVGILAERLTHKYVNIDKTKFVIGTRLSKSTYCTTQEIDQGSCEPYLELTTRSSRDKLVIQRSYKLFFGVLSELGGFNDLIVYSLLAFYFFYNTYSYKRTISKALGDELSDFEWVPESGKKRSKKILKKIGEWNEIGRSQNSCRVPQKSVGPLLELDVMVQVNSQAKIFLEMVFMRCPALEILLPKLIFDKKNKATKNSKTKNELDSLNKNTENDPFLINPSDDKIEVKDYEDEKLEEGGIYDQAEIPGNWRSKNDQEKKPPKDSGPKPAPSSPLDSPHLRMGKSVITSKNSRGPTKKTGRILKFGSMGQQKSKNYPSFNQMGKVRTNRKNKLNQKRKL